MKTGPDIARIAALLGDPARANMVTALAGGRALTAGELAREAGVTPQTASAHLSRLAEGGLIIVRRQGRHAYAALANAQVATLVETLMGLAESSGHGRTRPGPRDPALRRSRVCYDHLAGELGVRMLDALVRRGLIADHTGSLVLTASGAAAMSGLGIDAEALGRGRRPLCRPCLDWSERRSHLGGALGRAILDEVFRRGWGRRREGGREVIFSAPGLAAFEAALGPFSPDAPG